MQYVGRFVSSVYNTITPNINPATLSGAIDVIVVEREIEVEEDEDEGEEAGLHKPAAASGVATPTSPKSFVSSATSTSAASGSSHNILQSLRSSNGVPTSSSSASSLLTLTGKPKKKRKRIVTEMASTPFHVRFGKMSVLRPAERKVRNVPAFTHNADETDAYFTGDPPSQLF
jgi:phosphatidate phosphatase LPIN